MAAVRHAVEHWPGRTGDVMISIPMVFTHDPSRKPKRWPVTRGVPLPEGMLRGTDGLSVAHPDGARVPTQFRVIGHWPDGSVKWVLVDFQADADPIWHERFIH